ncbi:hypothetical protein L6164_027491 [Bauhinia variegata]|uniref:Uncharacterized protein n=1 Tax=Bauhinia variegata TaxID=167791 RepID=A0ACB9LTY3_BAUVA|nr:hypothetical protein L6164_027491 [Bauhinia variegata]
MAEKTMFFITCLLFLLLQHGFNSVAASRELRNIHPPPPAAIIPRVSFRSPIAPPLAWYRTNHYKINDEDAYRPTSPGHSPGMGHETPPSGH